MRCWLTIAALALPVAAQAQPPVTPVAVQPALPPLGARVRVVAEGILDGRRTATLLRRSGDTLTLALKDEDPVAVPLSRISSLETFIGASRRRGARRGAIIAGVFGMSLHVLSAGRTYLCERREDCDGRVYTEGRVTAAGLITGLAIGMPFGALLGSRWTTETWQPIDLAPKLSIGAGPSGIVSAGLTFAIP